jgi:predicted RNase H-like HicB family nuclease
MKPSLDTDMIRVTKQSITYELVPAGEGGYVITVVDYPSCASQGETIDEALANAEDALLGCLIVDSEVGLPIPLSLEMFLQESRRHHDEQKNQVTPSQPNHPRARKSRIRKNASNGKPRHHDQAG